MHSSTVLAILAFTAAGFAAPVAQDAYPPAYSPESYMTTTAKSYPSPKPYAYQETKTKPVKEYPTHTYEAPSYKSPIEYHSPATYEHKATPTAYETPKGYETPSHYEKAPVYATPSPYHETKAAPEYPKETYAKPSHYETHTKVAPAYTTPESYHTAPSYNTPKEYHTPAPAYTPEPKPYHPKKHHQKKPEADNMCSDNQKSACCNGGDGVGALLGAQCALSVLGGSCSGSVQCCDVDGNGELISLNLCIPINL